MHTPLRVGIIGCGKISSAYLTGLKAFPFIAVDAVADLDVEVARRRAAEFGVPRVLTVDALLADPAIAIVVNLTIPAAHAPINLRAVEAGKHVYVEKPWALDVPEGRAVLEAAARRGVRVACAPDTVLGRGTQVARHAVDSGLIGTPVAATAFMLCGGHESWHPSPAFYYQRGGGPHLDMGPYYLSSLVTLLGPIASVSGEASQAWPEREITSEPLRGTRVKVEVPTHVSASLRFASGPVATTVFSFDTKGGHHLPRIEVYGTAGTLLVPDPNTFEGDVLLRRAGEKEWAVVTPAHTHAVSRGAGVADLARAVEQGREPRASGALGLHVLEALLAMERSSSEGRRVAIATPASRPEAVPTGLVAGEWR